MSTNIAAADLASNRCYLVARPQKPAQLLIDLLAANKIKAEFLPLIAIQVHEEMNVAQLARVNACAGVVFSSPTAIDFFSAYLRRIECRVFSPGAATALQLLALGVRRVDFPAVGSGIQALIEQQLAAVIPQLTSLAVVGGDRINPRLAAFLNRSGVEFQFINLYRRSNWGLSNLSLIAKLINENSIVGIIITSTLIANYFCECIALLQLQKRVEQLNLLSIHPEISHCLHKHGFQRVYETASADNTAILTLIRKLEHERKR